LSFGITAGENAVVIAVAGEVDMATAPQLIDCLYDHADQNVVLDLSETRLLDSSGLSVLVRAYRAARDSGRTVRTTREPDIVRATLQVTGLFDLFHLDGEEPSA
jgi:anti-anti-sigma factor